MKAAFIRRYGGNKVVELGELPAPQAGPGELLVAVHAASVNPVDFKIRDGMLKMIIPFGFPLILGNDLSGVVKAVGAGVTHFKPGDAVFARMDKRRIGAFAEFAVVAEADAAAKPANLSHIEAAAVPLAGLTAWQALFEIGGLKAGQKVLIHGGSGGVGSVRHPARPHHAGATVATTVGARNADLARRLGADIVIDYKTQRFEDVVSDCDLVFDTQAGDIQHRSFAVLKRGGVLVSIAGKPDGRLVREFGLNPLLGAAARFPQPQIPAPGEAARRALRVPLHASERRAAGADRPPAREEGSVRTIVDKVFPLEQVREALAYSEAGHATGKVVVEVKAAW
jgi:alcohol dehydrogenase